MSCKARAANAKSAGMRSSKPAPASSSKKPPAIYKMKQARSKQRLYMSTLNAECKADRVCNPFCPLLHLTL